MKDIEVQNIINDETDRLEKEMYLILESFFCKSKSYRNFLS